MCPQNQEPLPEPNPSGVPPPELTPEEAAKKLATQKGKD